MTKKEKMYQEIKQHGENLNAIFETGIEPVALCKKLHRLEVKARHATTCLCNTNTLNLLELNQWTGYDIKQATEDEQDAFFDKIKKSVVKILSNKAKNAFFVNFDARGYALKLRPEFCKDKKIHQDWGSNGILAPEFNGN